MKPKSLRGFREREVDQCGNSKISKIKFTYAHRFDYSLPRFLLSHRFKPSMLDCDPGINRKLL